MRFKDIVFKNIKGNIRKYVLYFSSALFCVFMFVMYISLVLNDAFGGADNIVKDSEMPLKLFFIVSVIAILIFSVFFVSYANNSFMKQRSKELGTYEILGMDSRHVSLMVFAEMSLINLSAIAAGTIIGGLFSKLFQMGVLNILNIEAVSSSVKPEGILITIGVYLIILFAISLISILIFNHKDIDQLMKDNRRKEIKPYRAFDTVMMVIGLVTLIGSFLLLACFVTDYSVNSTMPFMLSYLGSIFIGVILLSYYGLKFLFNFLKKRKLYHKEMMSISKLEYKHKSNAKMILILSVLAAMIVLCVGAPLSLVSLSETISETSTADIEYATYLNNPDNQEQIDQLLKDKYLEDTVAKYNYVMINGLDVLVLDETNYNNSFSGSLHINKGHTAIGISTWVPGTLGFVIGSSIEINGKKTVNVVIDKAEKMNFFSNNLFAQKYFFVLNDEDFLEIKDANLEITMHKLSITNWKNSKDLVNSLKEIIINGAVYSRIENFEVLKTGYSTFFFVAASLAFMFFISTGCVTYFKMYNELEEEKKNFYKLYKIGITDKEIKKIINVELAFVYFTPLIFGGILGLSVMYYITNLFSFGSDTSFVPTFMLRGLLAWAIYLGFQCIFFIITKLKYQKEVLKMSF